MQNLIVIAIILLISLFLAFIAYFLMTQSLINSQEKELERLRAKIKELEGREAVYIVQDGRNPKFGDF